MISFDSVFLIFVYLTRIWVDSSRPLPGSSNWRKSILEETLELGEGEEGAIWPSGLGIRLSTEMRPLLCLVDVHVPQLCMLTLNNNGLDIHLTCVCSTKKDFQLYCAGVHNNPRQHFRQGHAYRAAGSLKLAIIDKLIEM